MTGSREGTDCDLFAQVMDYANRANPYPLMRGCVIPPWSAPPMGSISSAHTTKFAACCFTRRSVQMWCRG
jgi:hypothetical protein